MSDFHRQLRCSRTSVAIYIDGAAFHAGSRLRRDRCIRSDCETVTPQSNVRELSARDLARERAFVVATHVCLVKSKGILPFRHSGVGQVRKESAWSLYGVGSGIHVDSPTEIVDIFKLESIRNAVRCLLSSAFLRGSYRRARDARRQNVHLPRATLQEIGVIPADEITEIPTSEVAENGTA